MAKVLVGKYAYLSRRRVADTSLYDLWLRNYFHGTRSSFNRILSRSEIYDWFFMKPKVISFEVRSHGGHDDADDVLGCNAK